MKKYKVTLHYQDGEKLEVKIKEQDKALAVLRATLLHAVGKVVTDFDVEWLGEV